MNVLILGGGIAGLLGAYAFRRHKPTIIEASGKLGGNFTAGGLKYIHDTPDVRKLLKELDVSFEPYKPQGSILIDGHPCSHPETLAQMPALQRYQIQLKHWRKTRASSLGFREDCMNDPLGNHRALRCKHNQLLAKLEAAVRDAGCDVRLGSLVAGIGSVDPEFAPPGTRAVHLREGIGSCSIAYDLLLPTLPLGLLGKLAPWANLPTAEATKLAIFDIELPIHCRPSWDYMYTPEVKWISRIAQPEPHTLMVEVPWYLPQSDAVMGNQDPKGLKVLDTAPEVLFILKAELGLEGVCTGARLIPGHLRPLEGPLEWPINWYPLGRFAQWDSRATADKVYARALSIASGLPA